MQNFALDIVTREFHNSPFQLHEMLCSANMCEVQMDVGVALLTMSTTLETIKEFADKSQSARSLLICTTVKGSCNVAFLSGTASATMATNLEHTNVLKSLGARKIGSHVFQSTGVQRLAEVKITNFESS